MVQGMGIPPSQLQRELAEEKQHEGERAAAGQHHDGDRDRPTVGRRGQQAAIRLVLLLAALIALRSGLNRMYEWDNWAKATFHRTWQGWIGWLLLVILSGSLFALAGRLPRRLRYRPWTPLLIGIVPFLMLGHGVVLFGSEWVDPPRILGNFYFYMTLEAQFALAIMLGVAVASGFKDRDG